MALSKDEIERIAKASADEIVRRLEGIKPLEAWQMTQDEYVALMRQPLYEAGSFEGKYLNPLTHGYEKLPDIEQQFRTLHREVFEQALSEGKPVPAEVLADYPELVGGEQKVIPIAAHELDVGAWVSLKEGGPLHTIAGFERRRVRLVDGAGREQTIPSETKVYPL